MAAIQRLKVFYSGNAVVGTAVSTLHFTGTGSATADATAAQTKIFNLLEAIKATFPGGSLWTVSGQVDTIESTTGDLVSSIAIADVFSGGSASGEALPAANQLHLRFETGVILRGRRLRGHWYIPNVAELASNGNLSGAIYASLAAAKAAFMAGGIVPLVYNRPVGPHGGTRLGQAVVVNDVIARPKFAILRSRRD